MVIDLRDIKRQGKDEIDFFFEHVLDDALIDIPNVVFTAPIKINGNLVLTGEHSALISGEIEFTLKGDCTRCLSEATNTYVANFSEDFGLDSQNQNAVKGDKIDLTEMITETVLSAMPYSFLCKEDCLGLCPTCGKNLNVEKCNCNNK